MIIKNFIIERKKYSEKIHCKIQREIEKKKIYEKSDVYDVFMVVIVKLTASLCTVESNQIKVSQLGFCVYTERHISADCRKCRYRSPCVYSRVKRFCFVVFRSCAMSEWMDGTKSCIYSSQVYMRVHVCASLVFSHCAYVYIHSYTYVLCATNRSTDRTNERTAERPDMDAPMWCVYMLAHIFLW